MTDARDVAALAPGSTLLHVGPPKTGSTTLQAAFKACRDELASVGIRSLADDARARGAVSDLKSGSDAWVTDVRERRGSGHADREWISNEDFASLNDDEAARLVAGLAPRLTHVVYVVRPLERLLPSQWQQRVRRSLNAPTYDDWLRLVLDEGGGDPHHTHFWARHGLEDQVRKWTESAGLAPEAVTFVVAKEGDHSHLLSVFERLMGVPEGMLVAARSRNSSLSHSAAEFVRHLDAAVVEKKIDRAYYKDELKVHVSRTLRDLPKDPQETPILLPKWAVDRVRELDNQRVGLLTACDATVIGGPHWLMEAEPRVRQQEPDGPERMSVERMAALVAWAIQKEQRARRELKRVKAAHPRPQQGDKRGAVEEPTVSDATAKQLIRELGIRLFPRR